MSSNVLNMEESLNSATQITGGKDRQDSQVINTGDEHNEQKQEKAGQSFDQISDPKARKLAELVARLNENRHTTGSAGFRAHQNKKIEDCIKDLLTDSNKIEEQTFTDECEVYFSSEDSFFQNEDEEEIAELVSRQSLEIKDKKSRQEQEIGDMQKRIKAKKFRIEKNSELKRLHAVTRFQDMMYKKALETKKELEERRERTERNISHIKERHYKQLAHFNSAEERRAADLKILMDLQSRHLSTVERNASMKEFEARLTQSKALDKKKLDRLRDQQRIELRHFKDRAEYELRMLEEFSALEASQVLEQQELAEKAKVAKIAEKERLMQTQSLAKLTQVRYIHSEQLQQLGMHHKLQIRHLKQAQKVRRSKRMKVWSTIVGRDLSEMRGLVGRSESTNMLGSSSSAGGGGLGDSVNNPVLAQHGVGSRQELNVNDEIDEGEAADTVGEMAEQYDTLQDKQSEQEHVLAELSKKHDEEMYRLQNKHQNAFKTKQDAFHNELMQLEWEQKTELLDLKKSTEEEISETHAIQQREAEMGAQIRRAETKQLLERKILELLLDGVLDAVITINSKGIVQRFNSAASGMWGYSEKEVVGQSVKMLMPEKHSKNHDQYILNYLKTGVKKVVGFTRHLQARRKDGTEFPATLSVTEIVEDGVHLFNAMIRDLSEEQALIKQREAEEDCLPQMIWKVDTNGDSYYLNHRFVTYTGVSQGNVFDPSVVHPDDAKKSWKLFKDASITKEPFECKRRLKGTNGAYRWFLTRGSPILDERDNIISWCGSCTDVDATAKLQVESEALSETLPQAMWKADLEGNVLYANSNFLSYIGARKIAGLNVFSPTIIHKDDVEKSKAVFKNAIAEKSNFETRRRILGADGQYRWFLTRGSPVKDEDNSVLAFYGTCTDVHDETLQAIEMAALPESLPQLVWKVDPEGNVKYANKKFMDFCGAKEYTGLNVFSDKLIHPDDLEASNSAFEKGTEGKTEFKVQRRLKEKRGRYAKMQTIGVPILDGEKKIVGWYGTCTQL